METELQAAQEKLLQKRERIQTEKPIHLIGSIDESVGDVIERCKEKAKNFPMREYQEEYGEVMEDKNPAGYLLNHSGIPRLYYGCSFNNFQGNDKLISDIKNIIVDKENVVLRGNTGCGKTHLAVSMLKTGIDYYCKFISVPNLLLKIRSSFNGGSETEEEIINNFSGYKTLVLDDLGAEKTSEFSITTLYLILDRRISECRQTIITTNLSQKEIEEVFGARIASRMAGMVNLKINMSDYRKKRG